MEKEVNYNQECLITCACQHYFKEYYSDDIYELKLLRWFMNYKLFIREIEEYNLLSPKIIEAIENSEFKEVLYDYVYGLIVEQPASLIASNRSRKAIFRFKDNLSHIETHILEPYLKEKAVNALSLTYKQKMLRS